MFQNITNLMMLKQAQTQSHMCVYACWCPYVFVPSIVVLKSIPRIFWWWKIITNKEIPKSLTYYDDKFYINIYYAWYKIDINII